MRRSQTSFPCIGGIGFVLGDEEIGRLVFKVVDILAQESLSVGEARVILNQAQNIIDEESLVLIRPENYKYLQTSNNQEETT